MGEYKCPQCVDKLEILLGAEPRDRGNLIACGGHDPTQTPPTETQIRPRPPASPAALVLSPTAFGTPPPMYASQLPMHGSPHAVYPSNYALHGSPAALYPSQLAQIPPFGSPPHMNQSPGGWSPATPRSPSPRSPQSTPNRHPRGRRANIDHSLNSPRRKGKAVMSVEESVLNCCNQLSDVIRGHKMSMSKSSQSNDVDVIAKILTEDGLSESDPDYAHTMALCTHKQHRRTFFTLKTKEGRQAWVRAAWELNCTSKSK